jgi:hypothetical protein
VCSDGTVHLVKVAPIPQTTLKPTTGPSPAARVMKQQLAQSDATRISGNLATPQPVPVPQVSTDTLKPRTGSPAARAALGAAGPTPPAPPAPHPATCKSGFVWRVARADDLVCVTPASRARVAKENRTAAERVQPGGGAYGPNTCRSGFVWREAFNGDGVCVLPDIRALVRDENRLGPSRRLQP